MPLSINVCDRAQGNHHKVRKNQNQVDTALDSAENAKQLCQNPMFLSQILNTYNFYRCSFFTATFEQPRVKIYHYCDPTKVAVPWDYEYS